MFCMFSPLFLHALFLRPFFDILYLLPFLHILTLHVLLSYTYVFINICHACGTHSYTHTCISQTYDSMNNLLRLEYRFIFAQHILFFYYIPNLFCTFKKNLFCSISKQTILIFSSHLYIHTHFTYYDIGWFWDFCVLHFTNQGETIRHIMGKHYDGLDKLPKLFSHYTIYENIFL